MRESSSGESYDTRMAQASRAVTLRHKPVECGELRPQRSGRRASSEGRSERESAEDQAEVEEPLAPRPHSIRADNLGRTRNDIRTWLDAERN
jgi:hypothetical protein